MKKEIIRHIIIDNYNVYKYLRILNIDIIDYQHNELEEVCSIYNYKYPTLLKEIKKIQNKKVKIFIDYSSWEIDFLNLFITKNPKRYITKLVPEIEDYIKKIIIRSENQTSNSIEQQFNEFTINLNSYLLNKTYREYIKTEGFEKYLEMRCAKFRDLNKTLLKFFDTVKLLQADMKRKKTIYIFNKMNQLLYEKMQELNYLENIVMMSKIDN